jgi:hypothetical protein
MTGSKSARSRVRGCDFSDQEMTFRGALFRLLPPMRVRVVQTLVVQALVVLALVASMLVPWAPVSSPAAAAAVAPQSASAPSDAPRSGDKYAVNLEKARAALEARDFGAAQRFSFALTVLDAARWEGHVVLGAALLGAGKRDEARAAFAAARGAPAEVMLLVEHATQVAVPEAQSLPTEAADSAGANPSADQPVRDAERSAPEEPLSGRDKTRIAAARSIANDLNSERDPAERARLLKELAEATATLPSARGPRIEMLFLRALAALEADDGEMGWTAAQALRKLGALETDDEARLDVVARLQRKGWDAESKPDFVGEKRAKLEAELQKVQAEVRRAVVEATTVEWAYSNPSVVDSMSHRQSSEITFSGRSAALITTRRTKQRVAGPADLNDQQVEVLYFPFDVRELNVTTESEAWYELDLQRSVTHDSDTVGLSIFPRSRDRELWKVFGIDRPESGGAVIWNEGGDSGTKYRVPYPPPFAKSKSKVARLLEVLQRWKAIALELDALDAGGTAPPAVSK